MQVELINTTFVRSQNVNDIHIYISNFTVEDEEQEEPVETKVGGWFVEMNSRIDALSINWNY